MRSLAVAAGGNAAAFGRWAIDGVAYVAWRANELACRRMAQQRAVERWAKWAAGLEKRRRRITSSLPFAPAPARSAGRNGGDSALLAEP